MKNLFIIDPLEVITKKIANDSSTLLMESGLARGHEVYIATLNDFVLTSTFLKIKCQRVNSIDMEKGYSLSQAEELFGQDFEVMWLRKNPPFDETYLMHLALFDGLTNHQVLFINNPNSIRALNEKLTILNFPEFIIETIVTMKIEEIYQFWLQHGKIVVKGLTGFGGDSVIKIEDWKKDEEKLLQLSKQGQRFLMVQKFIEKVYAGDKRISIVDGEIIGALLRVPPKDSFIAYTGGGATVHETTISEKERVIAETVGKFLKQHDIFWAGIDLIDEHLSEINITSPSLLAAGNRKMGLQMELKIWETVEKRLKH